MAPLIADVTMHDGESSEEGYDENADEDFNPDKAHGDEEQSSSSEDEDEGGDASTAKPSKRPGKRTSDAAGDALDSGDEATIKERKRKRRKEHAADEGEESGGEGGFIMTRSQRLAAKSEKRERKRTTKGDVTIDVDRVWANLSSIPIGRAAMPPPKPETNETRIETTEPKPDPQPDETITIKRRIEFAGEVTEVEEQVPRSSKEAQRYLAEHPEADPDGRRAGVDPSGLRRPLRRPSMFEPNPLGAVRGVAMEKLRPRAPSRLDVLMAERRGEEDPGRKAQRMTTVQKSALDWKGFVEQGGYREELSTYAKSKKGFLAREAFLDSAAGAREQAAREARLKL